MTAIVNGNPKVVLEGTKDDSIRSIPPEALNVPIHLPLFMTYAERGPLNTQMGSIGDLKRIFGAKTFESRSDYATHATPFIHSIGGEANAVMFKRLVDPNAKAANAALWVILTQVELPVYARTDEGVYLLDEEGDRVPVSVTTVKGYKVRWELRQNFDYIFGQGEKVETGTGEEGKTFAFPVYDFDAGDVGSFGDNIGFRLFVPTINNTTTPDMDLIADEQAMVARFQIVERANAMSTPKPVQNLDGERSVDFTMKPGVVDKFDIEKYVDEAVIKSYEDTQTPGQPPVYSPIRKLHFYRDNFAKICQLLHQAETLAGEVDLTTSEFTAGLDVEEMNFFSCKTVRNVPFAAFELDKSSGTVLMSEHTVHYLAGGDDGNMSNKAMDGLVREVMLDGWEDPFDPLADMAKNPFSAIWDSGFGMEGKKALCEALGRRQDVVVLLNVFIDGEGPLSWSEEESRATALRAYASGYPESMVHGTPCCRAAVIAGEGKVIGGTWKRPVSLGLDLAGKIARYMGASNGIMKTAAAFDVAPNNQVKSLRDVTGTFKSDRQRQKDWNAGMIWAATYDRRSDFFPQYQTAYPEDTSVLNSLVNVFIMVSLQKVCASVWRDLTGNTTLTNDQFIERSDKLIAERTVNRFDNRVVIVPETFFTAADNARGYSWSCNVHMYANNMKTVGTFTVIAHRRDDLAA